MKTPKEQFEAEIQESMVKAQQALLEEPNSPEYRASVEGLQARFKDLERRVMEGFATGQLQRATTVGLTQGLQTVRGVVARLMMDVPQKPAFTLREGSKLTHEFTNMGVGLSADMHSPMDAGSDYQILILPIEDFHGQPYFMFNSSLSSTERTPSFFTRLEMIEPPEKADAPAGAVIEFETNRGEKGAVKFGSDGVAVINWVTPNGTTQEYHGKITERVLSQAVAKFILSHESSDTPRNLKVRVQGNELVLSGLPTSATDAQGRYAGALPEESFRIDLSFLPRGIEVRILRDKYIVLRDTKTSGFKRSEMGRALLGSRQKTDGEMVCFPLRKTVTANGKHRVTFSHGIDGEEGIFSDFEAFVNHQMKEVYTEEADKMSHRPATLCFRGIKLQGEGPLRNGSFRIKSTAGASTLLVNTTTGKIDPCAQWEENSCEVPASEIPAEFAAARRYVQSNASITAVIQEGREFYVITFQQGGTYSAKNVKTF